MSDEKIPLTDAERAELHAEATDHVLEAVRLMRLAEIAAVRLAADTELKERLRREPPQPYQMHPYLPRPEDPA